MGKGFIALAVVMFAGCTEHGQTPDRSLYESQVAPLLQAKCVSGACHDASGATSLDLSSYEGIDRRRDLLDPDHPLLLQKADGTVVHAGGIGFQVGSDAYETILAWIQDGAAD